MVEKFLFAIDETLLLFFPTFYLKINYFKFVK